MSDIPSGTIFHYIGSRHGAPLFRVEQIAIALGVDVSALGLVTEKPVRAPKRKIKKYLLSKLYFLLKERSKKGLTVSQLSKLSGVRASRIAAASFQKMILSFEEAEATAKALGISFDELGPVEGRRTYFRRENLLRFRLFVLIAIIFLLNTLVFMQNNCYTADTKGERR